MILTAIALLAFSAPADEAFLELVEPRKPEHLVIRLTSNAPASVSEVRTVQLAAGVNRLRHDWTRERIDDGSLRFEVEPSAGSASLVSTTRVRRMGKSLYYDVEASEATAANVTARYLLSGIGWKVDYLAALRSPAGGGQPLLDLRQSVEITDACGMDLENARIVFEGGELEGFTVREGERREVEVLRLEGIPVERRYVYDPARFGSTPGIELEIENSGTLARPLLPSGRMRIVSIEGDGNPKLIGEDVFPATPLGEKAKISTGHAPDITVKRHVLADGDENERRDRWNKVIARDHRTRVRYELTNGTGRPLELTIVERPGAPFEVVAAPDPHEKKDADTLEVRVPLEVEKETTIEIEWLRRNLF